MNARVEVRDANLSLMLKVNMFLASDASAGADSGSVLTHCCLARMNPCSKRKCREYSSAVQCSTFLMLISRYAEKVERGERKVLGRDDMNWLLKICRVVGIAVQRTIVTFEEKLVKLKVNADAIYSTFTFTFTCSQGENRGHIYVLYGKSSPSSSS